MARVYELPTHLEVEDRLIAGLTARQLLRLVLGATLAYGAADQLRWLPDEVRWAVAVAGVIGAMLFTFVRPHGRPLDQWLIVGLMYWMAPRQLVWLPLYEDARTSSREHDRWAELELNLEWTPGSAPVDGGNNRSSGALQPRSLWRRTSSV